MPIDTSMYGNLQPINSMQSLATMVGTANAMQQTQLLKNQNIQSGIDAEEMQAVRPLLSNTKDYLDERGNVDFNKLVPVVMGVAPKNGAAIIKSIAEAQQQKISMQNALMTQSADALGRSANAIASLDPDKTTVEDLGKMRDALNKNFDNPQAISANNQMFDMAINVAKNTKPGDPKRADGLKQMAMMYLPIQTQQAINTPTAVQMGNNQQTWLQNIKPGVGGIPQNSMIPNTAVQQQLPPNTPVVGPNNTPGYLGPQLAGNSPAGTNQPAGFVASDLPVGTKGNIDDNFKQMNTHFGSLQDQSQGVPLVRSLRSNVLHLAETAATGTFNDKKAFLSGILEAAGIPGTGDWKRDTELLDKYLTQLNLSNKDTTDAARALREIASPHSSMTKEAIKEAMNQVASQVEANMAIRNHLSGYKYANNGQGDSTAYQKERQAVEKIADPRIWQYLSLGKGTPEAKSFIKKLSKSDFDPSNKNGLMYKADQAQKMGLISWD
jgi:hypothetical protein